MIQELIGSRLIRFDNKGFEVVLKNGETRSFTYKEDGGGCCGFNELSTELLMSEDELERNPIITDIKMESEDDCDGNNVKITFFGEYKPLAQIDSYSSSGSGWCYGACVTVVCSQTDESEIISEW